MKKTIYLLLRAYVQLGLKFYFSSYKTFGTENIPKKGAIIFTSNHQNAFLDALVIVGQNHRLTHFLARAEVFKKPIFKWLMSLINMMPIYRIRDGWTTLNNNEEIFKACYKILAKRDALLIFPEGNHGFERRLRPLSKGFTRIAFGTLSEKPDLDLKIIPVGINYNNHQGFRTRVSLHFGEPIDVKPFYTNVEDHNASLKLRDALSIEMRKLTVHIDEENYEDTQRQLSKLNPDYSNLKQTMDQIQNLTGASEPNDVAIKRRNNIIYFILQANFFLPLLIWKRLARQIKDPVMLASIKFSFGIFLFPVFLIAQTALLHLIFENILLSSVYFIISLILPLLIKE